MKKALFLFVIVSCLLSLTACGGGGYDFTTTGPFTSTEEYTAIYFLPPTMLTDAPETLLADWDIKSVRDPYANVSGDGEWRMDYSMPVYRFDTYEDYLHLKEIIGADACPTVTPTVDPYTKSICYYDYQEGTFSNYSLLLGWFSVETPHTIDCYDPENATGEIVGKSLILTAPGGDTCNCTPDDACEMVSGLIWVAIPKASLEECESIAFILENCLVKDSAE